MLPRGFIIGAMRSGTSALARAVAAHPDLYLAPNKEIHFWDAYHARGVGWYEGQFAGMSAERMACDASPFMYDHEALDRLAGHIPDARLVAIIRNPVDRAYSHYWHNRRRDREPLSFEDAVASEAERTAGAVPPRRRMEHPEDNRYQYLYRGRSRYAEHLGHAEARFSREQILVIRNEELRNAPDVTVARVLRHFGLDPDRARAVARPAPRTPSLARRLKRRLRGGRERSLDQSYPPLEPALRARLFQEMEPDIAALEAWLGEALPASWRS